MARAARASSCHQDTGSRSGGQMQRDGLATAAQIGIGRRSAANAGTP